MPRRAWTLLLLILGGVLLQACTDPTPTPPPPPPKDKTNITFSANALSPADRQKFYHRAEGSELFPVAWVKHMNSSKTSKPFLENIERFGLIPDPDGPFFEGTQVRMPVGIAVSERAGLDALKPLGLNKMVGVNCAACHVGQIEYGDKKFRVDGGPNLFDIVDFLQEIAETAKKTYKDPKLLAEYLEKRIRYGEISLKGASAMISGQEIDLMKSYITLLDRFKDVQSPETPAGFGRADAFGTARALLFGKANARPLTGPSSFPYIWNIGRTAWFHWPSNTNSVMHRNLGEALGLGASADPKTGESTIDIYGLYELEQLAYKTAAPKWPEDIFGKIDQAKADRGEQIYKGMGDYAQTGNCTRCHDSGRPLANDPDIIDFTLVPLHVVGTDDNEAKNWAVPVTVDGKQLEFGAAQQVVLTRILERAKENMKKTRKDVDVDKVPWESGRKTPVAWRIAYPNPGSSELGYPTKPLAGIWSTAPYLHNGSVPTLADMLTPPAERPKTFAVGTREYDTKKLGYRTDKPGWIFDTTKKGNSNQGHPFGTTLKPEEKEDLLEYLKRLEPNFAKY
jgi:cytochrome c peroxidase